MRSMRLIRSNNNSRSVDLVFFKKIEKSVLLHVKVFDFLHFLGQ